MAALAAHRAWANALTILHEDGARVPSELAPARHQELNDEMKRLREALTLARGRGDAELQERYALAALARASEGVDDAWGDATGGVVFGSVGGLSERSHPPTYPSQQLQRTPYENHQRRVRYLLGPSLQVDPYGLAFRFAFHVDVLSTPAVAIPLGVDFALGVWPFAVQKGNEPWLATVMTEIGLRLRWPKEGPIPFVELVVGPGLSYAEGRDHFVWRRYRASVGIENRAIGYAVSYREEGRDADATIRSVDLSFIFRH